uniref:Uncharacterized protein n=1 Tax=Cacopsylla melanoneura TaxID=428564 RepID=A0A8D8Z769_9HEMI
MRLSAIALSLSLFIISFPISSSFPFSFLPLSSFFLSPSLLVQMSYHYMEEQFLVQGHARRLFVLLSHNSHTIQFSNLLIEESNDTIHHDVAICLRLTTSHTQAAALQAMWLMWPS